MKCLVDHLILTLSLNKASATAQTISVAKGTDISGEAINTLIKAYNDVMSTYKTMTANSANSDKPGNFANSPSTLSFINQIKDSFAKNGTVKDIGVPDELLTKEGLADKQMNRILQLSGYNRYEA